MYVPGDVTPPSWFYRSVVGPIDISHEAFTDVRLSAVALQDILSALGSLSMPALLTPGQG